MLLSIVWRRTGRVTCPHANDESGFEGESVASSGKKGEVGMNTNRSFSLVRILALAAGVLCLSASLASAQSAMKGEFTLPFEVHWGKAVLPAGQYSFNLPTTSAPHPSAKRKVKLRISRVIDNGTTAASMLSYLSNGTCWWVAYHSPGFECLLLRKNPTTYTLPLHSAGVSDSRQPVTSDRGMSGQQ